MHGKRFAPTEHNHSFAIEVEIPSLSYGRKATRHYCPEERKAFKLKQA